MCLVSDVKGTTMSKLESARVKWLLAGMWIVMAAGCQKPKTFDTDVPTLPNEKRVLEAIGDPDVAIVDVRSPKAYAEGHLPTAINIPLPEIRENDPLLGEAKQIIVYADSGASGLSKAGAKKMLRLGYVNVFEYAGGVEAWPNADRSLVGSVDPDQIRPETDR